MKGSNMTLLEELLQDIDMEPEDFMTDEEMFEQDLLQEFQRLNEEREYHEQR